MSFRSIHEYVIHLESFRNIDLWYQGGYLIQTKLYIPPTPPQTKTIHAHPFAHTQHMQASEELSLQQNQVFKHAWIDSSSSAFVSKAVLLRYYEEEAELNDICHFRIECNLGQPPPVLTLELNLYFFDNVKKTIEVDDIIPSKGKLVRTNRYSVPTGPNPIHELIPVVFDSQYFSVLNVAVHSLCVDYRYRASQLQLSQFSQLSTTQKRRLLEKNSRIQAQNIDYWSKICKQIGVEAAPGSLITIEKITLTEIKRQYSQLLKEYSVLFGRAIQQSHRQAYSNLLVHPSQLQLYQLQSLAPKISLFDQALQKNTRTDQLPKLAQQILNQTNLVSGQLLKLWHHFVDLIKISPRLIVAHYDIAKLAIDRAFWAQLRAPVSYVIQDVCVAPKERDNRHDLAEKQLFEARNNLSFRSQIISQELTMKSKALPLIVQEVYESVNFSYEKQHSEQQDSLSLHLVVLVHGFQGNSLDMKLIKNNISLLYPQASYLCSSANQEMTDNDIIDLGIRLATQVKSYIVQNFPLNSLQRISFVGHSLGGVIIRAALPKLSQLRRKFYSFMSFSSPHLGFKVNASSVIEAGIWVLQKFKNSNCLNQLTLADSTDPRQSCLYRISTFEGMSWFKHIFLFSAKQDSYAPYQSARIQIHPQFMNAKDPLKQVHCEMARNILKGVKPESLRRISQTNLDSIIGRTAHIMFLQSGDLIQNFLHSHPGLYE